MKKFIKYLPYKGKDEPTFINVEYLKELEFSRIFTKTTNLGGSKNDFEHMTNFSRLFEEIYQ